MNMYDIDTIADTMCTYIACIHVGVHIDIIYGVSTYIPCIHVCAPTCRDIMIDDTIDTIVMQLHSVS